MAVEYSNLIFVWNFLGGVIQFYIGDIVDADGWALCNPYWVHKYNTSVNWFGAIVLALGYSLLSPVAALCYWFYKLCTIGRK